MQTLGSDPDRARKIEIVPYDVAWARLFAAQEAKIRAALGGPALERAGYRLVIREPEWFAHRLFKGGAPQTNLHVFSDGCVELDRCRLFRDWLRVSPQDVELYARTKQELAIQTWAHVQDHANAKQGVIAEIMARARAWRPVSGRA